MEDKKAGKTLSFAQLIKGPVSYKRVPIPEIPDEDGNPSIILLKPLKALTVMAFSKIGEDGDERVTALCKLVAEAAVNEDGSPMMTAEEADELRKNVSMGIFVRLSRAINDDISDAAVAGAPKAQSVTTTGSDSPIA